MINFFSYGSSCLAKRESNSHLQQNIGDYSGDRKSFAG